MALLWVLMTGNWQVKLPGPGTGMAFASGLVGLGAGLGSLENELLILGLFVGATLMIELIHSVAAPGGKYLLDAETK